MIKNFLKCDVTCSFTSSSVTNCHTSNQLPSNVMYFMDGPQPMFPLRHVHVRAQTNRDTSAHQKT